MTDFQGWYSGDFGPGGRHALYRMRISMDNLMLPAFMAISGMNSFFKTVAYPSLQYRAMGPSLIPVDKQRSVMPTGVFCASEIDMQSTDQTH